ncbi:bifunctional non-homologous end joining protein LigD [Haloactinopolyspora alba]|uniref:Bifunctional non-homologous end joining protein LigD n=1 Tax=Haloactinopolyspora alba TaxID=648780 RepID=A0A2P8D6Z4_9ACTN|nr:non-homologous end-joining DNA ligase [Haloactinopolyspora alba]PSK92993.1 bifunctional non-homologous end joining protein LigD [Haloactinopolyspora alba]
MASSKVSVDVDGRRLALSNLDKVLYPRTGTVKSEVIEYYTRIAPVLLPHLAGRPITRKRWPDGVDEDSFFEKNAPRGTPSWVRTVDLPSPGSTMNRDTVTYVLADDLPTLVWLANLAVLEFHVPQWRVDDGAATAPDRLVVDLDPGEPATVVECCQVALLLAEALDRDGLPAYPKTSGSKGMQMYLPLDGSADSDTVSDYAHRLAERLEGDHPKLILSRMERRERRGKVFIDWSQNNSAKTTVAPYSLRGRETPSVSMPVGWDEVEQAARSGARRPLPLQFGTDAALERVDDDGDLLAPLFDRGYSLP